jgi:hypothetical protein
MKRGTLSSLRWGDQQNRTITAGGNLQFPEIIRVEAPMPVAWRLTGLVLPLNALGNGIVARLFLTTGIGQATFGPYNVPVPTSAMFSFEVSAQSIAGFFNLSTAPVTTDYTVALAIAPLVPWGEM